MNEIKLGAITANCKDCTHYNCRDNKCRLGSEKEDCFDFEPQEGTIEYEEENEEDAE